MTLCAANLDDPFRCPKKWELWRQLISLLPRGRAWQNHDHSVERITHSNGAEVGEFEVGTTGIGTEPSIETLTAMQQFWAAYAEVLEYLHQRACALLDEFFCSTVNELEAEWRIDYGFPDPCEPWHTLCEKVAAAGGATCAYLAGLAAARGWALTCSECEPQRHAVAGLASAGCAKTCGCPGSTIWVTIRLDQSPSYLRPTINAAKAGDARAGSSVAAPCPTGAEPLQCLIERFKPAHVRAVYIYEGAQ